MSNDIKDIIRQEYIKCAQDASHFMRKYCYIQHPQRARILFNLYPFQDKVLNLLTENPYTIINKSRQLGISTLAAGYALWLMTFHKDKNILCIATKQDTAKNMVTKVKFMYNNLPSWLKIKFEEQNKLTLRLTNGSQIKATSAAGDAGRSEAVSLLIVDEAAFISNIDEIWTSSQQTLATGGGAIVLSTPFGTGNWFHKTWVKAVENAPENKFLPIRLPWYVHPERDEAWREEQDSLLGDPRMAAQECDCDFSTSGDLVFYPEYIKYYEETYVKPPLEKRGMGQNLWVWEPPDYSRDYMVVCDVARGDDKDFSTAHVLDIETNTQVAEFRAKIGTKEFGNLLVSLATEYNEALLVVENANVGWSTIQTIIDRNYNNLYYSPKSEGAGAKKYFERYMDTSGMTPGFTNSNRVRPLLIGKLQEYISDRSVIIQSERTLEEMKVFVWKHGKPQAQQGYNDDLVIALGIGMYVRDTALKFSQRGIDLTKQSLKSMKVNRTKYTGVYNHKRIDNPYSIKTRDGNEDISWLLG